MGGVGLLEHELMGSDPKYTDLYPDDLRALIIPF